MAQTLYDFISAEMAQSQQQPGMAQQILSKRFEPNLEDASRASLQNFQSMAYDRPSAASGRDFADQRLAQAMKQIETVANIERARTGNTPAVLQVNDAIQKALDAGDYDTANRIAWLQRSQAYGVNTFNAPGGNSLPGSPQQYTPYTPQQPAAPMAPAAPAIQPMVPRARAGGNSIAQQIAQNAARKKGAETQAQKDVELGMNPKIEAATTTAGLNAKYMEEGRQSLPGIQRSLQSRELKEEFLQPKIDEVAQMARMAWSATGFTGALTGAIPGTPAYNLKAQVETLLANTGFDQLQEIRDNSPTGGALGQVTERELELLQATAQNLLNSQNEEQFLRNLQNFQNQRLRSLQNIRLAYEQDYQRFGGASDAFLPSPEAMMQGQSAGALQPYMERDLRVVTPNEVNDSSAAIDWREYFK